MKSFILRFLTALAGYQLGQSLTGAIVPDDMGRGSIWNVIDYTFNYRQYDLNRIGYMAFISGLLLLADRIGPKRIHIGWFALIAAFCGGYDIVMGAHDYFGDFDNNLDSYLRSVLPEAITFIPWIISFLLVRFFPPVLLAVIKLAGPPRFKRLSAVGGSKP